MNLIGKIKALFKRKEKQFYSTISLQNYVDLQRIISEEGDDYVKMQGVVKVVKGVDIDTLPIQEAHRIMDEVTEQLQQPLQYDEIRETYKFGDYKCTVTDADDMIMSILLAISCVGGNKKTSFVLNNNSYSNEFEW